MGIQEVNAKQDDIKTYSYQLTDLGWHSVFSPGPPLAICRKAAKDGAAAHSSCGPQTVGGGTAVIAKDGYKAIPIEQNKSNRLAAELKQSHRWCEAKIPIAQMGRVKNRWVPHIVVASWYGHSGANKAASTRDGAWADNEDFLAKAFEHAATYGDVPYYICADANVDSNASDVLSKALGGDQWHNVLQIARVRAGTNAPKRPLPPE